MKTLWGLACAALLFTGAMLANDHAYKKEATDKDLMAGLCKPQMDALAAMRKAGGPKDIDQWKQANASASLIAEGGQLLMLGGRVKDDAWRDGASKMITGAESAMIAAMRQDTNGWMESLNAMGRGCKTCHDVHKPKNE